MASLLCLTATLCSATELQLLTEENPPLNYSENGVPKGLSVDVVRGIQRRPDGGVRLRTDLGHEDFDAVVLACHSDQALALLEAPSSAEQRLLGAIRYQRNRALLHLDERLLPTRRRA